MDDLRRACAIVSGRARHVLVATQLIADYAAALPLEPPAPATQLTSVAERERAAAHWLQLDAVNFGSGWFPTLRKPGGRSGYRTIVTADLQRAGVAHFSDLGELTMFADNLVPHVLRLDGILSFAPELVARVERGDLIVSGSAEEIEIRAAAVHAVELIVSARPGSRAADIDQLLWERGQGAMYKASPRHRTRSTAY